MCQDNFRGLYSCDMMRVVSVFVVPLLARLSLKIVLDFIRIVGN